MFYTSKLGKGMSNYKPPFEWAKLILAGLSPLTMQGSNYASHYYFHYKAVFESYVVPFISKTLPEHMNLVTQVKTPVTGVI